MAVIPFVIFLAVASLFWRQIRLIVIEWILLLSLLQENLIINLNKYKSDGTIAIQRARPQRRRLTFFRLHPPNHQKEPLHPENKWHRLHLLHPQQKTANLSPQQLTLSPTQRNIVHLLRQRIPTKSNTTIYLTRSATSTQNHTSTLRYRKLHQWTIKISYTVLRG